MIGKNINPSKTNDSYNEKSKVNKLESRQANNINYDPDYNRNLNRPPPQQNYQQPIISNPILVPNQTNFNNNFNYPPANNNPYFMKFSTPPGYQNYNQNMNLMNELNFQNQNINFSAQNTKQPNLNILFNQFGYNNYGGHLNPQNNNSMNIGLVQQQPNITQQMYNKNFQDNRVNNNDVNGCVENLNFRTNNINPPFENNQFIVEENKKKQVPKENKANIGKIFNAENFPTLDEANNKN